MTTIEGAEQRRAPRHRSPSYPGIGLADAIERARTIYMNERTNTVPIDVANAHWGYKAGSSAGFVIVSALMKFGLLVDEGSGDRRSVRLTEQARRIILDADDRDDLIREAALGPAIYRELWERYPDGMPSRAALRRYLVVERNFNERVVEDLIDQFMDSLKFAGLLDADTISVDATDIKQPEAEPMTTMAAPPRLPPPDEPTRSVSSPPPDALRIPLTGGEWAYLTAAFPISEQQWQRMLAVLEAMKPGLIEDDPPAPEESLEPDAGSID